MPVLITYTEVSSGILRATELYKEPHNAAASAVARRPTIALSATVNIREKSNHQTFGEVSSSILAANHQKPEGPKDPETTPDDDGVKHFSNTLILAKFKKGLSMSFIARLSKTPMWVPLGGISCVRKASHQALMRREDENWPTFPPSEIWIMSVIVDWAPSAEMLISNFHNVLPGLRLLPDVLLDRRQDVELSQSRKVLVSPSGIVALYCGLVSKSEENEDIDFVASSRHLFSQTPSSDTVLAEKKRLIVTRLAQQNIRLSDEEKWVRLRNINSVHTVPKQDPDDFRSFSTFLWPASLCFCIAEPFTHKEGCVAFGQDSLTDPLLDAQNWFMRKGVRTEAIEANRKLKEAEAEKRNEEQNRARQDTFTDILPRPSQYSSAQDIASIYPTPPDGLPSQNTFTTAQRPTPASYGEAVGKVQLDGVDAEAHLAESPLASNLAPVIGSTTYEDDLYAEIDNDMFAANGLTDADLDFFDEPTADKNIDLTGDHDADLPGALSEKIEVSGFRSTLSTLDENVSEDDAELTTTDSRTVTGSKMLEIGTVNFALLNLILTQIPRCEASARCFNS